MKGSSLAERILIELGVQRPEDINLDALCKAYGINVHYQPMGDEDAFLFSSPNLSDVDFLINKSKHPVRRRFSIGHELGHYFLHRNKNLICVSSKINFQPSFDTRTDPEREADKFAAELLLPEYLVLPLMKAERSITILHIQNLARQFQTSFSATALRVAELSSHPIIVTMYGGDRRRQFFARSNLLSEKLWPPRILPDTALAAILKNDKQQCSGSLASDDWFDDYSQSIDIYEESIMRNGQTLSILTLEHDRFLAD